MEDTHSLSSSRATSHPTPAPADGARRRARTLRALLGAALATGLVALGCDEAATRPISAEVEAIVAPGDCDAGSNPGDFYISLTLYRIQENASQVITPLDSVEDVLYSLSSGEPPVVVDDVWVEGSVPASGEQRVLVYVELFESDGGGSGPTADDDVTLDWAPDQSCWVLAGEDDCLGNTGVLYEDNLVMSEGSGCNVVMAWRVLGE